MYRPSGEAENKSIRTDSEILRYIREDAAKQNISDNALINNILLKYAIFDRYLEDFPIITVVHEMINSFFEKYSPDEVSEIGYQIGIKTPKSVFLMKGITDVTLDSVLWYLENNHAKYARWFAINNHCLNNVNYIHLRHNLCKKWSSFLSGYMKGFFKSLLDIEINVDESESYVTITL